MASVVTRSAYEGNRRA